MVDSHLLYNRLLPPRMQSPLPFCPILSHRPLRSRGMILDIPWFHHWCHRKTGPYISMRQPAKPGGKPSVGEKPRVGERNRHKVGDEDDPVWPSETGSRVDQWVFDNGVNLS